MDESRCFCTLYDAVKVMIPAGIGYKLVNRYRMNAAFKTMTAKRSRIPRGRLSWR